MFFKRSCLLSVVGIVPFSLTVYIIKQQGNPFWLSVDLNIIPLNRIPLIPYWAVMPIILSILVTRLSRYILILTLSPDKTGTTYKQSLFVTWTKQANWLNRYTSSLGDNWNLPDRPRNNDRKSNLRWNLNSNRNEIHLRRNTAKFTNDYLFSTLRSRYDYYE